MASSSDDDTSNIDALDFLEYLMILYQMHRQQHQNFQIEVGRSGTWNAFIIHMRIAVRGPSTRKFQKNVDLSL